MKKIYASLLVALAGATALTASAKDITELIDFSNPIKITRPLSVPGQKFEALKGVSASHSTRFAAPAKAEESWVAVEGTGLFTDYVFGAGNIEAVFEKSSDTSYRITNAWSGVDEDMIAEGGLQPLYFDITDPENVLVPYQSTGVYSEYYGSEVYIQSLSSLAADWGMTREETIKEFGDVFLSYDSTDKVVQIPGKTLVVYFPDSEMETEDGEFVAEQIYIGNSNSMVIVLPGGTYTPEWVYWGEGEMKDGFISPAFGYKGEEDNPPYPVDIYKGNLEDNAGMIALNAWYLFGNDENMEVDIRDPRCVIIPMQYFGRVNVGVVTRMYYMSMSYAAGVGEEDGMTVEEFLESKHAECNISLADGKITTPVDCALFYLPDYDQENFYTLGASEPGYIILPGAEEGGISSVATDNNAPVEYYNIQGVRIAQPAAGQLVIKKQGSTVTKIVK